MDQDSSFVESCYLDSKLKSMNDSGQIAVEFCVRANTTGSEKVIVVGSEENLGKWMPNKGLFLKHTKEDIWKGSVTVSANVKEIKFRYAIVYHLQNSEKTPEKLLIIHRWESLPNPRHCFPNIRSNDRAIDVFGSYDGKTLIASGWISNEEEAVVFLRIHGEALKFYCNRYRKRTKEHRLKIVPFDVRFRETLSGTDDGESDDEKEQILPECPSYSITELSVLTRTDPLFGLQYDNGSIFRNNIDYLVFRTKTVAVQYLAFRVELYHGEKYSGTAYILPSVLPDTSGKTTHPIISLGNMPIGQIDVDYMIAKALPIDRLVRNNMLNSYGKYWRKRKTLEVGHRGMGSSYTKMASSRENTVQSLNSAARRGADYVEFDVQMTKDQIPVVYHDFHVLLQVTGRNGIPLDKKQHKHHQMAIKDLKLDQLNLLHFEHVDHVTKINETLPEGHTVIPTESERSRNNSAEDSDWLNPFPSLDTVLQNVDKNVGFNIEIKYPMPLKDGSHECENYFERNKFIDVILQAVFTKAAGRRIVFSSFDPDICTLISQKQHLYPVLFLVVGATDRYTPFKDIRSDSSQMAVHYAAASSLLGVNFHSEELLVNTDPLDMAARYGLVTFVWGDDLNKKETQAHFKNNLKVDGLIYDRIGEEVPRQNVFLVEKETREALFHPPGSPVSRRCSIDPMKMRPDVNPNRAKSPRRYNSVQQANPP